MWAVHTVCFVLLLHSALPDWTGEKMVETEDNWRVDERERHAGGRRETQIKGDRAAEGFEMK